MGMPVTGYIRIRKLQYAIVSLLEGAKVLDVAIMYEFDSHEGFTRASNLVVVLLEKSLNLYLCGFNDFYLSLKKIGF